MGKIVAIITAGGSGKRVSKQQKKQFIEINGRPLLFWTLDKFAEHELIEEIIVVLPADSQNFSNFILEEFPECSLKIVTGGKERQNSIMTALEACSSDTEIVLIHDGVRPFISKDEISSLISSATVNSAVIAASRVKSTIKHVISQKIERTVPREDLYEALTPQVFRYDLIYKYHQQAADEGLLFTDDAAVLEYYGQEVSILECSSRNFKITEPSDIELAAKLLTR